ncbi:MAG: hypothetical protein FH749_10980 [Firmicutes bacterium]|nr:hypothetical protein [Bacillota bacterium]
MFFVQVVMVSLVCGLATWLINHRLQKGPVLASAIVALVAGLVFPHIFAEGSTLAAVAACASYVGMSAKARLRGPVEAAIALGIAAALFVVTVDVFVGVGGKLGTIAAIAAMTVWAWGQVLPEPSTVGRLVKVYTRML